MVARRRKATEAEAGALASGIRLRIIRLTHAEALTNKELAERLGRDPATTLHHVRKLVETGFLEQQVPRKGNRGAKEIPYLSTGLSWQLENRDDTEVAAAMLEAYLAEIAETGMTGIDQSRLVVRLPESERAEFRRRLADLLEEFAARPQHPGEERMAIYVGLYPGR
ncbi:ArsR family transcriptional regulator [Prauserella marina]|uniref:Helix-turn-helix domain-containing protein n=1 Tax=Prauserella marina TaxID=530584 RepID=A0A222VU79_9PSEU|nr:winged helix-turn-helix domain-containing protein [Prauserella marina]ASR37487.1 ArsR family transcriptional regulator [Prauserella marina]PWV74619.1 helix-turn-helix protein [Prauserella marina]SDD45153.1 Helix-turn-helix domain-containing protein [Prauserella marina]